MPDLGYTTIGGSGDNSADNTCRVTNMPATSEIGELDSISVYIRDANTSAREVVGVLYDDDAGDADNLVASTSQTFDSGTNPNPKWVTISASYSLLDSTVYHVGFMQEDQITRYYYDSVGGYNARFDNSGTFPAPPDPISAVLGSGRRLSAYITYTAAGGVTGKSNPLYGPLGGPLYGPLG